MLIFGGLGRLLLQHMLMSGPSVWYCHQYIASLSSLTLGLTVKVIRLVTDRDHRYRNSDRAL